MTPRSPAPMIYVVDDDAAVAHALKFSLELEGFDVLTFSSGEALLDTADFAEHGCFVLDYNLPGRDGLDTLASLRSRKVGLPAILITSHPGLALRQRASAASTPIVEKPLLSDDLVRVLKTALAA